MKTMLSLTACRICGNRHGNKPYRIKEMMFGLGREFIYFECSNCGCLQISDIPEDISTYYPSDYYSFSRKSSKVTFDALKSPLSRLLKRERTRHAILGKGFFGKLVYKLFPDEIAKSISKIRLNRNSKILDVGCGSGNLLYCLKEIGFKKLFGIDKFIKSDITYANGLRIQKGSLQDLHGEWNLIMFNHSLEHISNQHETMQQVSKLLAQNGVCLVNTPTVSSYAWKTYKTNWVQLDPPRHYFLHSVRSLGLLAEKAELEVYYVLYNSTPFQFWGSEQYIRNIPLRSNKSCAEGPFASLSSIFKFKRYTQMSIQLNFINQGDQAAFYIMRKQ